MSWIPHYKQIGISSTSKDTNWLRSVFLGFVVAPMSAPSWIGSLMLPLVFRVFKMLLNGVWGAFVVSIGVVALLTYVFVLMPIYGLFGRLNVMEE